MSRQPQYLQGPIFAVTADVDWASEDALAILQEVFDAFRVKATYFVTHESAKLSEWYARGKIDRGIHPNFLPGSSHGSTLQEVLDTVIALAPEAQCSRSHMYFDASPVCQLLRERGFRYDSNLCTNLQPGIAPIRHSSGLLRFPCFFEDGSHSQLGLGWSFGPLRRHFASPGLKILSLHPMTIAMNVKDQLEWARLKARFPQPAWSQLNHQTLVSQALPGRGPRQFLEDILEFVRRGGYPLMSLHQLYETFGPQAKLDWRRDASLRK